MLGTDSLGYWSTEHEALAQPCKPLRPSEEIFLFQRVLKSLQIRKTLWRPYSSVAKAQTTNPPSPQPRPPSKIKPEIRGHEAHLKKGLSGFTRQLLLIRDGLQDLVQRPLTDPKGLRA